MHEGKEVGYVDVRDVVCCEFHADAIQVDGFWFGEVETALDAGVEEYTVDLRPSVRHSRSALW